MQIFVIEGGPERILADARNLRPTCDTLRKKGHHPVVRRASEEEVEDWRTVQLTLKLGIQA